MGTGMGMKMGREMLGQNWNGNKMFDWEWVGMGIGMIPCAWDQ